jgi:hypothetical protein
MWRISWSNSIIRSQDYRVAALRLAESNFRHTQASLVLVFLMTVQGIGYLLPTNFRVCLELQKVNPDNARIASLTNRYFFAVALQGVMQIVTIIIMARFATGI